MYQADDLFECLSQKCAPNCFAHAGFFQKLTQQDQCKCGKKSEVRALDQNLFATTVNMVEVMDTFKKFKCTDMTPKGRTAAIHQ